jgi:CRP-like cAMP-binding protein
LDAIAATSRRVGPREDLIREGDRPSDVHLIKEGYACRYKMMESGERKIIAWLLPGDICDLHVAVLGEMDHSIATLTECQVAQVPVGTVEELTRNERIGRALWWNTLSDEAILREWLVNVGGRTAVKRIAHLFCELRIRLKMAGRAWDGALWFPLTQAELAETMGMSNVHANRSLQTLREEGLIVLDDKTLHIPDPEKLERYSGFNPNYLHRGTVSRSREDT